MADNKTGFFISEENSWEDLGGGVSRQITGYNDNLMMVQVRFEEGGVGSAHTHDHSQASYVAAGQFEITIGDQVVTLNQGDTFFVDPGLVHSSRCIEAGILVDVFNPCRGDFISKE